MWDYLRRKLFGCTRVETSGSGRYACAGDLVGALCDELSSRYPDSDSWVALNVRGRPKAWIQIAKAGPLEWVINASYPSKEAPDIAFEQSGLRIKRDFRVSGHKPGKFVELRGPCASTAELAEFVLSLFESLHHFTPDDELEGYIQIT